MDRQMDNGQTAGLWTDNQTTEFPYPKCPHNIVQKAYGNQFKASIWPAILNVPLKHQIGYTTNDDDNNILDTQWSIDNMQIQEAQ